MLPYYDLSLVNLVNLKEYNRHFQLFIKYILIY